MKTPVEYAKFLFTESHPKRSLKMKDYPNKTEFWQNPPPHNTWISTGTYSSSFNITYSLFKGIDIRHDRFNLLFGKIQKGEFLDENGEFISTNLLLRYSFLKGYSGKLTTEDHSYRLKQINRKTIQIFPHGEHIELYRDELIVGEIINYNLGSFTIYEDGTTPFKILFLIAYNLYEMINTLDTD